MYCKLYMKQHSKRVSNSKSKQQHCMYVRVYTWDTTIYIPKDVRANGSSLNIYSINGTAQYSHQQQQKEAATVQYI